MKKNLETTIMGCIGTTIRIHSFIPRQQKVSLGSRSLGLRGSGFG